jgi:hypothetical protein
MIGRDLRGRRTNVYWAILSLLIQILKSKQGRALDVSVRTRLPSASTTGIGDHRVLERSFCLFLTA